MSSSAAIHLAGPVEAWSTGQSVVATSDCIEATTDLLRISVRPTDDGDVVELAGEIDVATAAQFTSAISRLLVEGRTHILVDLDAVTYLDGGGIRALITATYDAARASGSLWVTHNARCLRLLTITGEVHRLNITESFSRS